jgi:hemoglobin
MKRDIASREDIELIVRTFYGKVQADQLLAPLFVHVDWDIHLPLMYTFWASMILGEQSYRGNPFQPHVKLPLQRDHFQQWLKLFTETIDECFAGNKADEIKSRALSIAGVFQHKLNLIPVETKPL